MRTKKPMKAYLRAKRGKYKYSKHYFRVDGRSFCFWPKEERIVFRVRHAPSSTPTSSWRRILDSLCEKPRYRLIEGYPTHISEREFTCRLAAQLGLAYDTASSMEKLLWKTIMKTLMRGKTVDLEFLKKGK